MSYPRRGDFGSGNGWRQCWGVGSAKLCVPSSQGSLGSRDLVRLDFMGHPFAKGHGVSFSVRAGLAGPPKILP